MPAFTGAINADGAIVRVEVGVSRTKRFRLRQARQPIPQTAILSAVIDPGAEITCIDDRAARNVQLPANHSLTLVNAPSVAGLSYSTSYEIALVILHPSGNPG